MHDIREQLALRASLVGIGAHDGLTGRLGEKAGFDLIWGSGFEISASLGVPDANIVTMTELLDRCRTIAEAVGIPVIADCDNGFGNAINCANVTRRFERAGIAGICIEDNTFPKRCSFYEDVRRDLVSTREHALKIEACKDAQRGEEFFVIARTEALIAGAPVAEALERAYAYAEAGADAILVHSKQPEPDQLVEFAQRWSGDVPLVAVPTTYDTISVSSLQQLGFRIVIFANQSLRSAIWAIERNLRLLRREERASVLRSEMVGLDHIFELVGLDKLRADEARYLDGVAGAPARQAAIPDALTVTGTEEARAR